MGPDGVTPRDLTVRRGARDARGKRLERAVPSCRPDADRRRRCSTASATWRRQPFLVVGTPEQVADEIERWLDEVGIDGINLLQYHSYDTARDFIELVVPVLRDRGRLRDDPATSLRDRLLRSRATGCRATHIGARYRGGANLDVPVPPLEVAPRDADAAA